MLKPKRAMVTRIAREQSAGHMGRGRGVLSRTERGAKGKRRDVLRQMFLQETRVVKACAAAATNTHLREPETKFQRRARQQSQ